MFELEDNKTSVASTEVGNSICDDCEEEREGLANCNVCQQTYCSRCWDRQATHKRRALGPGGVPHEKTDPDLAEKIHKILDPEVLDHKEQQLKHVEDYYTKWFGVIRDDSGQVLFQNSARFESIMATVKQNTMDSSRHELKYPSLISFVGETGAGKSTLIKALVEVLLLNYLFCWPY